MAQLNDNIQNRGNKQGGVVQRAAHTYCRIQYYTGNNGRMAHRFRTLWFDNNAHRFGALRRQLGYDVVVPVKTQRSTRGLTISPLRLRRQPPHMVSQQSDRQQGRHCRKQRCGLSRRRHLLTAAVRSVNHRTLYYCLLLSMASDVLRRRVLVYRLCVCRLLDQ